MVPKRSEGDESTWGCGVALVLAAIVVILFLQTVGGRVTLWGILLLIGAIVALIVVLGALGSKESYFIQQKLDELRAMSPSEFEDFLVWLFTQYGFTVKKTARQGDHGVDLVLYKDGKKYAVQAKRFKEGQNIGEPMLREFYGSFEDYDAQAGYFVTTSDFTQPAREWAARRRGRLHLINGDKLIDMVRSLKHKEE